MRDLWRVGHRCRLRNANTGDNAASARSAEGAAFVNTCEYAASARTVEGLASVSIVDDATSARTVEGAASVSTGDDAAGAKSVAGAASVSMGENAASARTVEGAASVSMGEYAAGARSVEGAASVSMGANAAGARTARLLWSTPQPAPQKTKEMKPQRLPGPPSARGRRQEGRSAVRLPSRRSAAFRCLSSPADTVEATSRRWRRAQ